MTICIACSEEIQDSASKCPRCGAFQTNWKNWIPTASAIFSTLAVLISIIALTMTFLEEAWNYFWWEDKLTIVQYNIRGKQYFVNSGSGDLFVEYVRAEAVNLKARNDVPVKQFQSIGSIVGRGSIAAIDNSPKGEFGIYAKYSDEDWQKLKGDWFKYGFDVNFYSQGNPEISALAVDPGMPDFRSIEAACWVGFRSVRNPQNTKEEKFDCLALFIKPSAP